MQVTIWGVGTVYMDLRDAAVYFGCITEQEIAAFVASHEDTQ